MKKTITKEIYICDYCLKEGLEVEAVGKLQPSDEDVCHKHLSAFSKEVRLPSEAGGDMSGIRISVTPTYEPKLVISFEKKKEVKSA